jgi:septum formation protein
MNRPSRLVLASSSPRRRELLSLLGHPFSVVPSSTDESFDPQRDPAQVVEDLALKKALEVSASLEGALVIGADTLVYLSNGSGSDGTEMDASGNRDRPERIGTILGKPRDQADALRMLVALSGRTHAVITGVAVVDSSTGQRSVSHCRTEVRMRALDPETLRRYVQTKEPMDKAGAYAIQGVGSVLIEEICGDYFNVVGLPLAQLSGMLLDFGFEIFPHMR